MNIFKNLILALLISAGFTDAFAMEEGITKEAPTTGPDFPVDIWGEKVKQIINDKELSLEQKAKKLNDLIITSKNAKTAVDNWMEKIDSIAAKQRNPLESEILWKIQFSKINRDVARKIMTNENMSLDKKIDDLFHAQAYGAIRELLKTLSNDEKQKILDNYLYNQSAYNSAHDNTKKNIIFLLKEGANPNWTSTQERYLILTKIVEKIKGYFSERKTLPVIKPLLNIMEELLKNGANPDLPDKNNDNLTPLQYAKKLAKEYQDQAFQKENIEKAIALMEKYSKNSGK